MANIAAIAFTPIINASKLANGRDEFISTEEYLNEITMYTKILFAVANITADQFNILKEENTESFTFQSGS